MLLKTHPSYQTTPGSVEKSAVLKCVKFIDVKWCLITCHNAKFAKDAKTFLRCNQFRRVSKRDYTTKPFSFICKRKSHGNFKATNLNSKY